MEKRNLQWGTARPWGWEKLKPPPTCFHGHPWDLRKSNANFSVIPSPMYSQSLVSTTLRLACQCAPKSTALNVIYLSNFWRYVIRSPAIWEELVKGLGTLPMLYPITANYKTLASPVGQL